MKIGLTSAARSTKLYRARSQSRGSTGSRFSVLASGSDMMDRPAIGDKIFIAMMPCDDDIAVVESKFSGTNTELLMLAQGRLFFSREEAEMYVMHCKAIIAAMRAQLPELEDGFDED